MKDTIPVDPSAIADHADDQQLVRRMQHSQLADDRAEQSTQPVQIPIDGHRRRPMQWDRDGRVGDRGMRIDEATQRSSGDWVRPLSGWDLRAH